MVDTMALLPAFFRPTRNDTTVHLARRTPRTDDDVTPRRARRPPRPRPGRGRAGRVTRPPPPCSPPPARRAQWEDRDAVRHCGSPPSPAPAPSGSRPGARPTPDDPDALLVARPAGGGPRLALAGPGRAAARGEPADHGRRRAPTTATRCPGGSRWTTRAAPAPGTPYFEELWEAAVRRSPHHYGCHVAALRYLAAVLARLAPRVLRLRRAGPPRTRPPGSLVQALPLRAALALSDATAAAPRCPARGWTRRPTARSPSPPASRRPTPGRPRSATSSLYVLVRLERWEDALDPAAR